MKAPLRTPWLLACLILLGGCYKVTFYKNTKVVRGVEHDEWTSFFIYGLVGSESVDIRSFCGKTEVAEVQTGGNFATGLVSTITLGIYTPRKIYVTCSSFSGIHRGAVTPPRKLELSLDSSGTPVHAVVSNQGREEVARVTPVSSGVYRISHESEVMP
jgi:hypothetical protein